MFGKTLKTIPKVIHTGRKRLRAERTRFNTLEVINVIYKEFDPGSGRTLAARLTHASRTSEKASSLLLVRLACVRRAASVRPEPGSNSL